MKISFYSETPSSNQIEEYLSVLGKKGFNLDIGIPPYKIKKLNSFLQKNKKFKNFGIWPLFFKRDNNLIKDIFFGRYWITPYNYNKISKTIENEIKYIHKNENIKRVVLDLEFINFIKAMIKNDSIRTHLELLIDILHEYDLKVKVTHIAPSNCVPRNADIISKMLYTQHWPIPLKWKQKMVKRKCKKLKERWGKKAGIDLGGFTWGPFIKYNNTKNQPKELIKEIKIAKKIKMKEVGIYELNGFKKEWINLIKKSL